MIKRFINIFANTEYSNFSDQMTIIFSYQDNILTISYVTAHFSTIIIRKRLMNRLFDTFCNFT